VKAVVTTRRNCESQSARKLLWPFLRGNGLCDRAGNGSPGHGSVGRMGYFFGWVTCVTAHCTSTGDPRCLFDHMIYHTFSRPTTCQTTDQAVPLSHSQLRCPAKQQLGRSRKHLSATLWHRTKTAVGYSSIFGRTLTILQRL